MSDMFLSFDGEPITGKPPVRTVVHGDLTVDNVDSGFVSYCVGKANGQFRLSTSPTGVANFLHPDGMRVRVVKNFSEITAHVWPVGGDTESLRDIPPYFTFFCDPDGNQRSAATCWKDIDPLTSGEGEIDWLERLRQGNKAFSEIHPGNVTWFSDTTTSDVIANIVLSWWGGPNGRYDARKPRVAELDRERFFINGWAVKCSVEPIGCACEEVDENGVKKVVVHVVSVSYKRGTYRCRLTISTFPLKNVISAALYDKKLKLAETQHSLDIALEDVFPGTYLSSSSEYATGVKLIQPALFNGSGNLFCTMLCADYARKRGHKEQYSTEHWSLFDRACVEISPRGVIANLTGPVCLSQTYTIDYDESKDGNPNVGSYSFLIEKRVDVKRKIPLAADYIKDNVSLLFIEFDVKRSMSDRESKSWNNDAGKVAWEWIVVDAEAGPHNDWNEQTQLYDARSHDNGEIITGYSTKSIGEGSVEYIFESISKHRLLIDQTELHTTEQNLSTSDYRTYSYEFIGYSPYDHNILSGYADFIGTSQNNSERSDTSRSHTLSGDYLISRFVDENDGAIGITSSELSKLGTSQQSTIVVAGDIRSGVVSYFHNSPHSDYIYYTDGYAYGKSLELPPPAMHIDVFSLVNYRFFSVPPSYFDKSSNTDRGFNAAYWPAVPGHCSTGSTTTSFSDSDFLDPISTNSTHEDLGVPQSAKTQYVFFFDTETKALIDKKMIELVPRT